MKLKCPSCGHTSDEMMEDKGILDSCPIVDMVVRINSKTLEEKGFAYTCFYCGTESRNHKTKKELEEKEIKWQNNS